MASSYLRQSPLAHLHLAARTQNSDALPEAGVHISENAHRGQIVVRGQASDPAFLQATEKVMGIPLPTDACTSSGDPAGIHILWMGPDEWLIVTPEGTAPKFITSLSKAFRRLHAAIVDVSESRTVIQIRGLNARNVLDKGCSIDLHPRVFAPGNVVNTLLGRCHITVHQTSLDTLSNHPSYDIYVHRSFSEYLWSWIEDASREYGVDVGG